MHQDVPTRPAPPEPASAPATRRTRITQGVRDSFSAGLGIALGLLIIQAGLPWWLAPALSLSAFAGSLELLLVGMIATVTPRRRRHRRLRRPAQRLHLTPYRRSTCSVHFLTPRDVRMSVAS